MPGADGRTQDPLSLEVVLDIRDRLWLKTGWDGPGMDDKGIWLAICLGFDSGNRIGMVTLKDGPNGVDHCIRAGHVTIVCKKPERGYSCRHSWRGIERLVSTRVEAHSYVYVSTISYI